MDFKQLMIICLCFIFAFCWYDERKQNNILFYEFQEYKDTIKEICKDNTNILNKIQDYENEIKKEKENKFIEALEYN